VSCLHLPAVAFALLQKSVFVRRYNYYSLVTVGFSGVVFGLKVRAGVKSRAGCSDRCCSWRTGWSSCSHCYMLCKQVVFGLKVSAGDSAGCKAGHLQLLLRVVQANCKGVSCRATQAGLGKGCDMWHMQRSLLQHLGMHMLHHSQCKKPHVLHVAGVGWLQARWRGAHVGCACACTLQLGACTGSGEQAWNNTHAYIACVGSVLSVGRNAAGSRPYLQDM
jgi:hypothetical protein